MWRIITRAAPYIAGLAAVFLLILIYMAVRGNS